MGLKSSLRNGSSDTKREQPAPQERSWSAQQQAIFDWFARVANDALSTGVNWALTEGRNLVVRARAGTGKTTTIIEGINRAPEARIGLFAFNKKIAEELSTRISNPNAEAKTLHALGFAAIRNAYGPVRVDDKRGLWLTDRVVPKDTPFQIKVLVTKLHTKGRDMLGEIGTYQEMLDLAFRFDCVPDDGWRKYPVEWVVNYAIDAMKFAAKETKPATIDYADMIFLPLVQNLLTPIYDLGVVDEAQDMTIAQLNMVLRSVTSNGRIVVVGDNRQAIYGFRGADSNSIDRLKQELHAIELPLNVTYRCAGGIVARAKALVSDFEGVKPATDTDVLDDENSTTGKMLNEAAPGEFILSRVNAPLVSYTLQLIAARKRARMAGRDIGKALENIIVKKMKLQPSDSTELMAKRVEDWRAKQTTRLAAFGQQDKIAAVVDQAETLLALAEAYETVGELLNSCTWLFEDGARGDTIVLSTIHKAKGLEAPRVWLLQDTLYRRGRTSDEENCEYVAITRAKDQLVVVR